LLRVGEDSFYLVSEVSIDSNTKKGEAVLRLSKHLVTFIKTFQLSF
jgi:hypothetical protein